MKSVMFVDDESRILDGIRRMLYAERKRWDMEFCLGGEAALKAMQSKTFDVVVSDMRMPGMDGATLLARVCEVSPITVRIILSGHTEMEAAMRAVPVAHRFLAKPCNASVLRETIDRTCQLQDVLNDTSIRTIVTSVAVLPSSPESYRALMNTLGDPGVSIERLTEIIRQDMAMSAKVLQFANSAFFGASQTVTTVAGSVGYLGVETIRNLAMSVKTFRVQEPHPDVPQEFWAELSTHATRTAKIASKLPLEKEPLDIAVSAAFLHELGDLVVAGCMPSKFKQISVHAREKGWKTFQAEEEILGFSHAEIGAYLLGIWGLPTSIVETIEHHHHPDRVPHNRFDPTLAVYVADLLSRDLSELTPYDQACLEKLSLTGQFEEWAKSLPQDALSAGA